MADPKYTFDSVRGFFEEYVTKAPATIFQDTLNLIYIESKRKNLS